MNGVRDKTKEVRHSECDYEKDYMIKFNCDDKQTSKILFNTITIRYAFEENGKLYPKLDGNLILRIILIMILSKK